MHQRGRQLLAILLTLALCLSTAGMVFAQVGTAQCGSGSMGGHGGTGHGGMGPGHGGHHGNYNLSFRGTVVAIDTTALTLTVNVTQACRTQTDLIGQDVTFTIDENAVVMIAGVGPGDLEDILVDDTVKVMGKIVNGEYVATRIVVY